MNAELGSIIRAKGNQFVGAARAASASRERDEEGRTREAIRVEGQAGGARAMMNDAGVNSVGHLVQPACTLGERDAMGEEGRRAKKERECSVG